jgi:hypothetical protein
VVEHSIELAAGEVVRIGDVRLVVLDVGDAEVTFRIERVDGVEVSPVVVTAARLPR